MSLKPACRLQVKVVCQFKGREMDFKDLAFKLFQRFIDDIGEVQTQELSDTLGTRLLQIVTF